MFVKTVKFNKKTAVAIIIAAAAVIAAVILIAGGEAGESAARPGSSLRSNDERIAYLEKAGWQVEAEPVNRQTVIIPRELEGVIAEYNELQKKQGFDLGEFCGLELELFNYRVTNYPNCSDEVWASLYLYNGRVVAGDIHSTAMDGFMHGLKRE